MAVVGVGTGIDLIVIAVLVPVADASDIFDVVVIVSVGAVMVVVGEYGSDVGGSDACSPGGCEHKGWRQV